MAFLVTKLMPFQSDPNFSHSVTPVKLGEGKGAQDSRDNEFAAPHATVVPRVSEPLEPRSYLWRAIVRLQQSPCLNALRLVQSAVRSFLLEGLPLFNVQPLCHQASTRLLVSSCAWR